MQRLYDEIKTVKRTQDPMESPLLAWSEVHDLPYLDACINEGVRLHPPFCLPLERVVPAEGVDICGHFFPKGTVVGMSPWVANRHRPTFGEDADSWRPERWLGLDAEQYKKLNNSMLTVRPRWFNGLNVCNHDGTDPFVLVRSGQTRLLGQEHCIARNEEAGLGARPKLRGSPPLSFRWSILTRFGQSCQRPSAS